MITESEIRGLCGAVLAREPEVLDFPSENDWAVLERQLTTTFPPEFKSFMALMAEFTFPGDIYNVSQCGRTNGNDTILTVYESELANSDWPGDLIPFYGIGNGDYFVFDRREGAHSAVYYRYHEDGRIEKYCQSFEAWLRNLPRFLVGEEDVEQ